MRGLFVFFLILCCLDLSAQNSEKGIEVQSSAVFIGKTFRLYGSPQYVIDKGNSQIAFGPNIMLASEATISDGDNPKLIGLQAGYEWYPLKGSERLNFFFFDDLYLNRIVDRWISNRWNNTTQSYDTFDNSNTEILIQNHVGYGIRWKITKNLSLEQSVGAGIYYSDNKRQHENKEVVQNINGYDNFGFSYGANLAIEITL